MQTSSIAQSGVPLDMITKRSAAWNKRIDSSLHANDNTTHLGDHGANARTMERTVRWDAWIHVPPLPRPHAAPSISHMPPLPDQKGGHMGSEGGGFHEGHAEGASDPSDPFG